MDRLSPQPLDPLALALAAQLRDRLGIRGGVEETVAVEVPEARVWQLHEITDTTVDGPRRPIPIRTYRPSPTPDLPMLVYAHGGGWLIGDLDTDDLVCRELSARAECIVISVDYCLAPEYRFPHALEEVVAVCDWASDQGRSIGGDGSRLAIAGESAGGNLAAAACLTARERGGSSFIAQVLIYPALDPDLDRPELTPNDDPVMRTKLLQMMWRQYLASDDDRNNPLAAPVLTDGASLPPAVIVTAETDPLRFDGQAYASVLTSAGVPVTHLPCAGLFHGFFGLPHPEAMKAMDQVIERIRASFDA